MNIFGARSLPAAPAEAAWIARRAQVLCLSLGEGRGSGDASGIPVRRRWGGSRMDDVV